MYHVEHLGYMFIAMFTLPVVTESPDSGELCNLILAKFEPKQCSHWPPGPTNRSSISTVYNVI